MSLLVRLGSKRAASRTIRPKLGSRFKRHYTIHQPARFVPESQEVTLYVKGFLARGESAYDFHDWFATHDIICNMENKKWGPNVVAFQWLNGDLPIPVPLVSGALLGYRILRFGSLLSKLTPLGLIAGASVDVALYAGLLAAEYHRAEKSLDEQSYILAEALMKLHARHSKVRVVAHSLGCRLLFHATQTMPPEQRPHEIHLLAPALTEEEVGPHLDNIATDRITVYHNKGDYILSLLYTGVTAGSEAIGSAGLRRTYLKTTAVDTSPYFDYLVHTEYKNKFHTFVH